MPESRCDSVRSAIPSARARFSPFNTLRRQVVIASLKLLCSIAYLTRLGISLLQPRVIIRRIGTIIVPLLHLPLGILAMATITRLLLLLVEIRVTTGREISVL